MTAGRPAGRLPPAVQPQARRAGPEDHSPATPGTTSCCPPTRWPQLREIYDQVQYRAAGLRRLGLRRASWRWARGSTCCSPGRPAPARPWPPRCWPHALGLDLYKIDLSTVVSKYIGETEKNLARIFAEARDQQRHPVLRRGRRAVRQAHRGPRRPRPLRQHRDQLPAAEDGGVRGRGRSWPPTCARTWTRRSSAGCTSRVEFPLPDAADRRRIWEQIWPAATPRDPDLDLDLLARRVEVTGGSIRNIALAGAFLAAADGGVVTMAHLLPRDPARVPEDGQGADRKRTR